MGCNYTPNKKETKPAEEVARSIVYGEGDDSKEFLIERITAAIEAERQRVEGLEQRIGFHEQTIRELNKVPLPEVVKLRELTSNLRQRLKDAEKWMDHAYYCRVHKGVSIVSYPCTCGLDDFRKEK
jgi:uncharacterized coiled-coil protein SlyX